MTRAVLLYLLTLIIWIIVVSVFWLSQPVSSQELLANYAKARDFFSAAQSIGGLPWWSPMFLQGTSLAPSWSLIITNFVMLGFSIPLGFLVGPKLAMILCIGVGSAGILCFLRKYVGDDLCAAMGGTLFLCSPSLLTRAAHFEHFAVVCSMALLPWSFLGLLMFFRSPSPRTAILSAILYAATFLAYAKIGLIALPILLIFCATEFFGRPVEQRPSIKLLGLASGIFSLLAVIPNLPALREMHFAAMFELSPFEGWQQAFSTKSAMGWIDRAGWLISGIDTSYAPTTGNGGTYLGVVSFIFLTISLFQKILHKSQIGRQARTCLVLGLFSFWLSFGPLGVLGGQLTFLELATHAPDFAPAVAWFFLAAQVWIIFRLIPQEWPGRTVIATLLSIIYLTVPGFRIIELLPFYKNIRAPFDFFQIPGAICVIFATAITIRILLSKISSLAWRSFLVAGAFVIAFVDAAPYASPFFQKQMEREVFEDFVKTQNFLRTSSHPGRVFAFSGRYFYLLTPVFSGRALASEAFNSYLQQRGVAILQGASFLSDEYLREYMRIAGIAYLLIDKTDPDTSADIQERLRKLFPPAFENTHFAILENKDSLGNGFLAQNFVQTDTDAATVATAALGGARYNLATIQFQEPPNDEPNLRGRVVEGWIAPKAGSAFKEIVPFQRIKALPNGTYQSITFEASHIPGWMVMNQAWHPDWKAFVGHQEAPIYRAFLGFSAVYTNGKDPVKFHFEPPLWYSLCAFIGIITWGACLACSLIMPLPPTRSAPPRGLQKPPYLRQRICRPLVIIPTYNEATGILEILDKTIRQSDSIAILVVDDGSPDGTADLIRKHPAFSKRIYLLERERKLGLGSAYKSGFAWARDNHFDAVIEMDADLSHNPSDIPKLLEELNNGADAAIGSRYLGGVRVINWPQHRLILSTFASKFVQLATGLPLTDATSGFKALRMSAVEKISHSTLKTEGYGFQIELHYALWKSGANLVEIPIVFTERRRGHTKMTLGIAWEAFLRVLQLARKNTSSPNREDCEP